MCRDIGLYQTIKLLNRNANKLYILVMAGLHRDKYLCMPEEKITSEDEHHWLCDMRQCIGIPHPCCDPEARC